MYISNIASKKEKVQATYDLIWEIPKDPIYIYIYIIYIIKKKRSSFIWSNIRNPKWWKEQMGNFNDVIGIDKEERMIYCIWMVYEINELNRNGRIFIYFCKEKGFI